MRHLPILGLAVALVAGLAGGVVGLLLWLTLWDEAHQGMPRLLWLLRQIHVHVALANVIVMSVAALLFAGSLAAMGRGRIAWSWLVAAVLMATAAAAAGFAAITWAGASPGAFPAAAFWIGAATAILLRNRIMAL